ncbi:MAG: hypothetical protein ABIP55_04460 [Tepidisphaeraceae bacterium]
MSTRRGLSIACAIAVGMILPPLALAGLAAGEDSPSSEIAIGENVTYNTPAIDAADFSTFLEPTDTELPDPQPLAFSLAGEGNDLAHDPTHNLAGPPRRWADANLVMARPEELANSPMAPLPPAIVAGPIGIAFAAYFAWRAKHRRS